MEPQKLCFFDSAPIEASTNVTRVVHAAEKHPDNPVMTPTEPWEMEGGDERGYLGRPGGVTYDESAETYRMWYRGRLDGENTNLYAESTDGLDWHRPELGVFEYDGSTANNVLGHPPPKVPSVLSDSEADPDHRYKLFSYYFAERGDPGEDLGAKDGPEIGTNVVMHSPDGVTWTEYDESPVHDRERYPNVEDSSSVFYDPHEGLYVGTGQLGSPEGRRLYTTTSEDFREWTPPRPALAEDDRDRELVRRKGGDRADYYYLTGHTYEGLWLGFAHFYEVGVSAGLDNGEGPIDVRLALSRDRGRTWEKTWHDVEGADAVIPRGPPGAFDHGMVFTANQPIVEDDRMVLYYGGRDGGHDVTNDRSGAIGIASWPLDRFVSHRSRGEVGTVTTVPTTVTGEEMVVNADPTVDGEDGHLEVEVLDRGGAPLRGYERAASTTVETDSLRHPVTWDGGQTLAGLRGRELKFRFYLTDAHLYTMTLR